MDVLLFIILITLKNIYNPYILRTDMHRQRILCFILLWMRRVAEGWMVHGNGRGQIASRPSVNVLAIPCILSRGIQLSRRGTFPFSLHPGFLLLRNQPPKGWSFWDLWKLTPPSISSFSFLPRSDDGTRGGSHLSEGAPPEIRDIEGSDHDPRTYLPPRYREIARHLEHTLVRSRGIVDPTSENRFPY